MSDSLRIARGVMNGEVITPVLDKTGRVLSEAEMVVLSKQATVERYVRRVRFVLFDESKLPEGGHLDLSECRIPESPKHLPLMPGDLSVPIGIIETINPADAGTIPNTTGRAEIATARLYETHLASLAWNAIQARIWSGVCPEFRSQPIHNVPMTTDDISVVHLGGISSAHNPHARVIEWWEDPKWST